MKKLHSLRWIILLRLLPFTFLVLVVIGFWTHRNMQRAIYGEVDVRLARTADTTAARMSNRFDLLRSSARALAENDLLINAIVDKQQRDQQLNVFFRSLRLPGSAFQRVTMFDYRGRPIVSSQGKEPVDAVSFVDKVMAGNEHFQIDADRIIVACPIRYNSEPEAVIAIEYDTAAFVQDHYSPEPGRRLRLMRGGLILYDSSAIGIDPSNIDPSNTGPIKMDPSDAEPVGVATQSAVSDEAARSWISATAKVDRYDRLAIEQAEEAELAFASMKPANWFILLASVSFVAALLIGILSAVHLATQPLRKLARQIADIQDSNDLSGRVDDSPSREVNRLTTSFNRMMDSVSRSTVSLGELQRSEDRLRTVLQSVPNGIIEMDADGVIKSVNAPLAFMLGYESGALVGKPIEEIIPRLDFAATETWSDAGYQEWNAKDAFGNSIVVEVGLSPLQLDESPGDSGDHGSGRPGVLASVVDVTQRRAGERENEKLRHQTQVILDCIPAMVLFKDTENRLLRVNRTAAEVIGFSTDEIEGRHSRDFFPDHELYYQDDLVVIESRQPRLGIIESVPASDGSLRWVNTDKIPMFDDRGEMTGLLAVIHDVTDLKQTQESLALTNTELRRSNDELAQFAYVASHDLQEPLRKVVAFCELLNEDYGETLKGDGAMYLNYIVDGATRMRTLIQDLLSFSSIQAKGHEPKIVRLRPLIDDVLDNLSEAIKDSQAKITFGPLDSVYADKTQLIRLLQNVVGNAIKYRSEESPEIHIESNVRDGRDVISVRDNGIGIEPQYQEQIFGVFKRLHTMDAYPGTGIGLAVCKRIIQRIGGEIWIESQLGKGSTFFVAIPRKPAS